MFFALRCHVASLLCSRRLVVLAVACSVEGSSRCVVLSLSSVRLRRSVRCCLLASRLMLLRRCAHVTLLCSLSLAVMQCSSRCFVSSSGSRAPCCAPVCRWCPALPLGRWWLWCGCRGHAGGLRLAPLGCSPLPRGLFSVEGVGGVFGGHKNNPQALILEGGWGGGSFHAYEQYTPWCHTMSSVEAEASPGLPSTGSLRPACLLALVSPWLSIGGYGRG